VTGPALRPAYWESGGRKTAVAAFLLVAIVGGLYMAAGSFASMFIVLARYLASPPAATGHGLNYLEGLRRTYQQFQVPLLSLTLVFEFVFFLGLTLFIFRRWHGLKVREYFRLKPAHPILLLLAVAGAVALIPFVNWTAELLMKPFPVLRELEEASNALLTVRKPWHWVFLILTVGVTPAICEEFLFRGYFHRTLERTFGQPGVFFLSGAVFGLIHQNYFGLVALVLVGAYLGFVYQRIRSLWASSLSHFAYNTTLIVLLNLAPAGAAMTKADGSSKAIVVLGSLIASILIITVITLATRSRKETSAVTAGGEVTSATE